MSGSLAEIRWSVIIIIIIGVVVIPESFSYQR